MSLASWFVSRGRLGSLAMPILSHACRTDSIMVNPGRFQTDPLPTAGAGKRRAPLASAGRQPYSIAAFRRGRSVVLSLARAPIV